MWVFVAHTFKLVDFIVSCEEVHLRLCESPVDVLNRDGGKAEFADKHTFPIRYGEVGSQQGVYRLLQPQPQSNYMNDL